MADAGKKKASKSGKKTPAKKASKAGKKATGAKKSAKKATTPSTPPGKRSAAPKPPAGDEPKPREEEAAPSLPQFVKDASPAERKAAVEQLAQDAGIAPILARAPWRRKSEEKAAAAPGAGSGARQKRAMPARLEADADAASRVGVRGAKPVILDTNALMMQFQFHIDVEKELKRLLEFKHEIIVPSIVVDELTALAEEAVGKDAGEARMALEFARTFKVVDAPGAGDTGILQLAVKLNALVVTNDKILRARLRAKDVPNIYMRKSAFLTLEGHVAGV